MVSSPVTTPETVNKCCSFLHPCQQMLTFVFLMVPFRPVRWNLITIKICISLCKPFVSNVIPYGCIQIETSKTIALGNLKKIIQGAEEIATIRDPPEDPVYFPIGTQ